MQLNDWLILKQELLLCCIILGILVVWLWKEPSNESWITGMNLVLFFNLIAGLLDFNYGNLFGDSFVASPLILAEKTILNLSVWIIGLFSYDWCKKANNLPEFYLLLLTSLLGMFLMLSSRNLLLFYLGLEMSSLPLAAAAGFDFGRRNSPEAAMKLVISSAFSSALLLMGISWLYGLTGTLDYSGLMTHIGHSPLSILAFLLILSGFAFKISAVPFHLWTADVYQGAPTAVTAFLSVVSKSAIFMVMIPVFYQTFEEKIDIWHPAMILLALASILVANFFAIRQDNLKRLLAFSSIAQVGFLLIGFSAHTQSGATAVLYFLLIYLFSNLAAFGVVAVLSAHYNKEQIGDLSGLYKQHPFLSWILTIALFSLAGIPPTAGFFGKFFLLLSGSGTGNYWVIGIAAINMVISLYYYLRVVKTIFMDQPVHEVPKQPISFPVKFALLFCTVGIVLIGFLGFFYEHLFQLLNGIN
jgi:NADH-quinone oxidoreductase subunit N